MPRKPLLVGANVFAFASSAIVALPAVAADDGKPDVANLHQLRDRCGNDAAAFFIRRQKVEAKEKNVFKEKTGHSLSYDYKNNYSAPMKGCFICITITIPEPSSSDPSARMIVDELFNVNTYRMLGYGIFAEQGQTQSISHGCQLNGVECGSEAEWWTKIKPYVPPPSK